MNAPSEPCTDEGCVYCLGGLPMLAGERAMLEVVIEGLSDWRHMTHIELRKAVNESLNVLEEMLELQELPRREGPNGHA